MALTEDQKRAIEYLKRLPNHLYRLDYNDISSSLNNYFPSLPITVTERKEIGRLEEIQPRDSTIIFRSRENETEIAEKGKMKFPFKTVSEVSIIPDDKKHCIKYFGRCNKPEEPRFYASNDYRTCCIESITSGFTKPISESKFTTVGCWKITEPLILAEINYCEDSITQILQHDSERYSQILNLAKENNKKNIKQIAKDNPSNAEYIIELYNFFTKEFAKSKVIGDYDYKLINYYCDHIFDYTTLEDKTTKIDGILYPSISFSYQEKNLVLHPRAMKKIKFINAMMVWLNKKQDGIIEFITLEDNILSDDKGNLKWKEFIW